MAGKRRVLPDGSIFDEKRFGDVKKRARIALDHICHLCGKEIDMSLPPFNPLAPELDHIIPISRGGAAYDLENTRWSHSRCNRRKGNRLSGDKKDLKEKEILPLSNQW